MVGKKGKTISDIQKRHTVEIVTAEPRPNDETQIIITGTLQNTLRALEDIQQIISTQLDNEDKDKPNRKEHEGNICKFHREGTCRYGDRCWRIHLPKHHEHPNTEPTSYRKRSQTRSPPRKSHYRQRNSRSPPRKYHQPDPSPRRTIAENYDDRYAYHTHDRENRNPRNSRKNLDIHVEQRTNRSRSRPGRSEYRTGTRK